MAYSKPIMSTTTVYIIAVAKKKKKIQLQTAKWPRLSNWLQTSVTAD